MAIARLVCGACSAVLSQGDKFCPQCGSAIEAADGSSSPTAHRVLLARCKVCGNEVNAAASFCESCGTALKGTSPAKHEQQAKDQERQRRNSGSQGGSKAKGKKKFSVEPWQAITGVVVVGLVAYFVYSEMNREQPVAKPSVVQEILPAQSAAMMKEIDQLQQTVDANPKDDASLIRLANMLHDAAMSNPNLLMRAINTYTKYLKQKPSDPNARVDLGICYFEMARVDTSNGASLFSKAIQEMETVFKANPRHQPATFNLGVVNLNAGNFEKSTEWFKKAVEINPNSDLGKKAQQLLEQHSSQGAPN
jgi:ribosomal protein S15P/S13E